MEKFNRAERRRQAARLKAKRSKSYWGRQTWGGEPMDARLAGLVTNTSTLCSKHCCGNPRKWYGARTLKEIVHIIELKEASMTRL